MADKTLVQQYLGDSLLRAVIYGCGVENLSAYQEVVQIENLYEYPTLLAFPSRKTKERHFKPFPVLKSGTVKDILSSVNNTVAKLAFTQSEVGIFCEHSKLRSKLLAYNHDQNNKDAKNSSNFFLIECGSPDNQYYVIGELVYYTNGTRPSLRIVDDSRFLDAEKYNYYVWLRVPVSSLSSLKK